MDDHAAPTVRAGTLADRVMAGVMQPDAIVEISNFKALDGNVARPYDPQSGGITTRVAAAIDRYPRLPLWPAAAPVGAGIDDRIVIQDGW